MAYILTLPSFHDERGSLTVIEKILPFEIKRVYYMYNVRGKRGGHRHKDTTQALVMLTGNCNVFVDNSKEQNKFMLNSPEECLILEPEDWHTMSEFSQGGVLLVLSSHYYDDEDYIEERY